MCKCGCGSDKIVSGYMWHVGGWGRIGCSHGLICYSKCSAIRKVTRREAEGDSVRSQFIFTLNMSKSSLQSSSIQFFSKYLISVRSRQYTSAKHALQLFEALLLSVGISGESNCYKCSQRERRRQNWSGDCCLRMKQNCIKGSLHHLPLEGEP